MLDRRLSLLENPEKIRSGLIAQWQKGELLKVHAQTHPKERLPVQPVTYRGSHDD